MTKLDQLFIEVINIGVKTIDMIVEPKDKAIACAEIAKALAMKSDSVKEIKEQVKGKESISKPDKATKEKPTDKQVSKPKDKSEEPKTEIKESEEKEETKIKEPEEKEETKIEEPEEKEETKIEEKESDSIEDTPVSEEPKQGEKTEEPLNDPELVEEWTDEMQALKAEQLATIQSYMDVYSSEVLDECVQTFSDNVLQSIAEISPLNIDAFVIFMKELENSAQ